MSLKPKYLLVYLLLFLLTACSSTRKIEKSFNENAYKALGLQQERKDNVELYKEAASWLRIPHRGGGLSRNGIDCSGLVYVIYKKVYAKTLERNSEQIMKKNCRKKRKGALREGDLVFFNSGKGLKIRRNINHVGIYLKDHKFIHTSTSRGVMVSDLNEDYYRKAWVCGGRVKNR